MSSRSSRYPWALLYNLESQLTQQPAPAVKRPGRPPRLIPRSRFTLLLTADEERALQHITAAIQEKLYPAKISRSQVVGMAVRMLNMRLEESELGEDVTDWPSLIAALAGEGH
jgi:hypothetical protein